MTRRFILAAALVIAGTARAGIPLLDVTCPGNLAVHADEGGPVFIDCKETRLKKVNDAYFEAEGAGVNLSIGIDPDGSATLSYTGTHGANGICSAGDSGASGEHRGGGGTSLAEKACLAAVAETVNLSRDSLSVSDVTTAEAGIGVMVRVPGATAPWSCLSDAKGQVQGVMFTGKDGDRVP
jgi:hypothetical protein